MPKLNKRRSAKRIYVRKRWYDQQVLSENDSASEEEDITSDAYDEAEFIRFADKMKIDDIGDLFELIKDKIGLKFSSVLLYMTLRYFGISWLKCDNCFKKVGVSTIKTADKWASIFLSGNYNEFVCEVKSCRLDLRRWGARFESNSQRPYFEGHERQDVVQHRTTFLQYFLPKKDSYYLISDDIQPKWQIPTTGTPTILIFHDESTFRSGEVSAKRWLYDNQAPFYSKGRGRSNMLSDFLVMHNSDLGEEQDIDYIERSASASKNVDSGAYFDNSTILTQFERFCKLLQFKKCFSNHQIEIIVDNARTHSARAYNLSDFGKGISTRCPVDQL
ncbi:unnamed protein product [Rotaria magnacalcarata]|uniref:Uncharacterized protein n=1 Tax=Rotaria magnacalcarata TaxID=392030 RepID=A0A820CNI0_9BILA|nr:unnamed protein product [Rotaria magnacalcarata]CAF4405317.1 unnamed protein product [Rotaria magnacalcarata]